MDRKEILAYAITGLFGVGCALFGCAIGRRSGLSEGFRVGYDGGKSDGKLEGVLEVWDIVCENRDKNSGSLT